MTNYIIRHDESDSEWIEENPTPEKLDIFYNNGQLDIIKIDENICTYCHKEIGNYRISYPESNKYYCSDQCEKNDKSIIIEKNTELHLKDVKGGNIKQMETIQEGQPTNNNNVEEMPEIPTSEPKQQFDATKFEGQRVKIVKVYRADYESHYVPEIGTDGKPTGENIYDKDKTVNVPAVTIETETVETIKGDDGDIEIKAKHRFNLQKDSKGNVTISKHPKCKIWQFMRKQGVTDYRKLVGTSVTLTTRPSKSEDDDRVWLDIVV